MLDRALLNRGNLNAVVRRAGAVMAALLQWEWNWEASPPSPGPVPPFRVLQ